MSDHVWKGGGPSVIVAPAMSALAVTAQSEHASPSAAHPFSGITYEELAKLPNSRLNDVMRAGSMPTAELLADFEFRGFNPPGFAKALGFQKFFKGFFVDDAGKLAGYNLFVEDARGGITAPWVAKKGGGPKNRHGFYDVEPTKPGRYYDFPNAVLLNYGSGRNSAFNPEARIRDFLVQVDPGNPDIFLGKAYVDLGLTRAFSNFFLLERFDSAPISER